jgi:hypothetical protein
MLHHWRQLRFAFGFSLAAYDDHIIHFRQSEDVSMQRDDVDRPPTDTNKWNPDGSYRDAADRRLFVPSEIGVGWTLNMGHRFATLAMIGVIVLALTIVGIATAWFTRAAV